MSTSLRHIAAQIEDDWKKVNYGARPYLDAMRSLDSIKDNYYADSGSSVVLYFLANAGSWRGDEARRIKRILREMVA
jgi:hypothetical protein